MELPAHVLLIDDDPVVRKLIRAALVKRGMQVTEAANGEAGLAAWRDGRAEIVLLDALMPAMDGFATCQALRTLPGATHVPVVILTSLDDDASIARAYESGATDFFVKTPQMTLLAERIRYLLRTARMREELAQSREKLATAQRIARVGSWEWELQARSMRASSACFDLLGLPETDQAVAEQGFIERFYPDGVDAFRFAVLAGLKSGQSHQLEGAVLRHDGMHALEIDVQAELDANQVIARVVGTLHDITERRAAEQKIRQLADFDGLTGLPNRNFFRASLDEAIQHAKLHAGALAVLVVNVDRFTLINETYGRVGGDVVLREVAQRLARTLKRVLPGAQVDVDRAQLARIGADEFVALLPAPGDSTQLAAIAQEMIDALRAVIHVQGQECWLATNVGIARYPLDGDSAEILLAHASTARAAAKSAGRYTYRLYASNQAQHDVAQLQLERDLRKAVAQNDLRLHWQPIVDARSGRIVAAEALMRWQRGTELIAPSAFIPLAEDTGLIFAMGEWALQTACQQIHAWTLAGLPAIAVSVNLSSAHVQQRDLPAAITRILQDTGCPPEQLRIEITETGLMDFSESTLQTLRAIRALGVRIGIDDFGTGYSALSYLKRLPVSVLKIDRSFVRDVAGDAGDTAIISAICGMAQTLSLQTIAEGVETAAQCAALQRCGVQWMQGFYFSAAQPPEVFAQLLRDNAT